MAHLAVDPSMKTAPQGGLFRAVTDSGDLLSLTRTEVLRQCTDVRIYDFAGDDDPVKFTFPRGGVDVVAALDGKLNPRALLVDAFGQDIKEMSLPQAVATASATRDGSEVWNATKTERWNFRASAFEPCSDFPGPPS